MDETRAYITALLLLIVGSIKRKAVGFEPTKVYYQLEVIAPPLSTWISLPVRILIFD